jgi:hypothetical protein
MKWHLTLAIVVTNACIVVAQEAPKIKPGYATDGRPGFVAHYTVEDLKWQRYEIPGVPAGIAAKILSRDDRRGALSLMIYYPNGWKNVAGYNDADQELFVLEGDLTIGDQKLTKYSYTFIPAGMSQGPVSTRQGAVVLTFFNTHARFVPSEKNKSGARVHALIRDWNFYKTPWNTAAMPVYRKGPPLPGLRLKLLRHDKDTGEMTWMTFGVGGGPGGGTGLWEVHPTFEEYFLVERSGDSTVGECLTNGPTPMTYGNRGYWFRPADIGHIGGISRSTGYGMSLVRTGGPLWAYYYTDCTYSQQVEVTGEGGGFKLVPRDYKPGPHNYSTGAVLQQAGNGQSSATKP